MKTPMAASVRIAKTTVVLTLLAAASGCAYIGGATVTSKVLTRNLSEPLNGARSILVDINTGSGNLVIDRLTGGEPVLASGDLQYVESQGVPVSSVQTTGSRAALTLKGGADRTPRFNWPPWKACTTAATDWQIHLNPAISSEISARSGGGNFKLNLAGMAITRLAAETGGGDMDVVLPDNAADLEVAARTGGGNVTIEIGSGTTGINKLDAGSGAGNMVVRVPSGMAARIHATSGLGKVIVDPRFAKLDKETYQSADYEGAASKVDITVKSGAGNVSVNTK